MAAEANAAGLHGERLENLAIRLSHVGRRRGGDVGRRGQLGAQDVEVGVHAAHDAARRLIGGVDREEPDLGVDAGALLGVEVDFHERIGLPRARYRDAGAVERREAAVHVRIGSGQELLESLALGVDDLANEGLCFDLHVGGHLGLELRERGDGAAHLRVVVELQHLVVQIAQGLLAAIRVQKPLRVGEHLVARGQRVAAGRGEERIVGHRVDEPVRDA